MNEQLGFGWTVVVYHTIQIRHVETASSDVSHDHDGADSSSGRWGEEQQGRGGGSWQDRLLGNVVINHLNFAVLILRAAWSMVPKTQVTLQLARVRRPSKYLRGSSR
jgi:hypothetical protein